MNLTSLVRKLENKLKIAESLSRKHAAEAANVRGRLAVVARLLGQKLLGKTPRQAKRVRRLSAAARARIAAAQHRRWAKYRARTGKKTVRKVKRGRKMSAAGRARIVAAQKKRWAAFHQKQKA